MEEKTTGTLEEELEKIELQNKTEDSVNEIKNNDVLDNMRREDSEEEKKEREASQKRQAGFKEYDDQIFEDEQNTWVSQEEGEARRMGHFDVQSGTQRGAIKGHSDINPESVIQNDEGIDITGIKSVIEEAKSIIKEEKKKEEEREAEKQQGEFFTDFSEDVEEEEEEYEPEIGQRLFS